MISLLDNGTVTTEASAVVEEEQLIQNIYLFANKKDEWFNLLLSLSNFLAISDELSAEHPYKELSARILSHLKNALAISIKLNASAKHLSSSSILDNIPAGTLIVDHNARIVEQNQLAKTIIESSPYLDSDGTYLTLRNHHLPRLLETHGNTFNLDSIKPIFPAIDESRKSLGQKLKSKHYEIKMHIIPLTGVDAENQYFYLNFQTGKENSVNPRQLKKHYELTETEALVAATLVNEISSQKTANKLRLKESTVRGHLTNIYTKMQVSRKPELIRKVLLHTLLPDRTENELSGIVPAETQRSQFIFLRDGRKLSYIDYWHTENPQDKNSGKTETILLLHNLMGSCFELPPAAMDLSKDSDIRIIVPERPGYGDSDPLPNRSHKDFSDDIEELLNILKIHKVKVIAHSIGGVYALALAEYLPDRVSRIAMVNAMPRREDLVDDKGKAPVLVTALLRSLKYAPFLIEPILKMAVGKDIEHFYEQQLSYIRPTREGQAADINLLRTQNYRQYSVRNLKQSAKQGVKIWAEELKLSIAALPFQLENKKVEYFFWHGEHDDVVPVSATIKLAKSLNTIEFHRIESETHFLFARRFNEVVARLLS